MTDVSTARLGPLIERAKTLLHTNYADLDLWWGCSGAPLTGAQIAAHADAAAAFLHAVGWDPAPAARRGLRDALMHTARVHSTDTWFTAADLVSILAHAASGVPQHEYEMWDQDPGRTAEEVLAMLAAVAAFARRYGPRTGRPGVPDHYPLAR